MKETTRIHIAKVPYDIELSAKHDIEKYIKELESYARDDELMQDIEIRITELLAERSVIANGVISSDDVKSIREKLGEPRDFKSDDDEDVSETKESQNTVRRKLFRDKDSAILGGVLSGFSGYFGVDPFWVRLAFVILMLMSGGTLILVYFVLWLIMPPARTATEKMQMTGKPVNLHSIREFSESESQMTARYERANTARRVVSFFFGSLFLIMAISTLMGTIFAALGIAHFNPLGNIMQFSNHWDFIGAFVLAIISGVLLSILFGVISFASYVRKFTKNIGIGIAAIIIAGIVSFSTAVALVTFQTGDQITNNIKQSKVTIPDGFSGINSLTVNSDQTEINYIVSNTPRIYIQSLIQDDKPSMTVNGKNADLSFKNTIDSRWFNAQPIITIYGPKLDSIKVSHGILFYSADEQNLSVEISGDDSTLNLKSGVFDNIAIKTAGTSLFDATSVTINNVILDQSGGSTANLGNIKTLSANQPQSCPANETSSLNIKSVLSKTIQYNGSKINFADQNTDCGSITISE